MFMSLTVVYCASKGGIVGLEHVRGVKVLLAEIQGLGVSNINWANSPGFAYGCVHVFDFTTKGGKCSGSIVASLSNIPNCPPTS